jgi:hypothetical protein
MTNQSQVVFSMDDPTGGKRKEDEVREREREALYSKPSGNPGDAFITQGEENANCFCDSHRENVPHPPGTFSLKLSHFLRS